MRVASELFCLGKFTSTLSFDTLLPNRKITRNRGSRANHVTVLTSHLRMQIEKKRKDKETRACTIRARVYFIFVRAGARQYFLYHIEKKNVEWSIGWYVDIFGRAQDEREIIVLHKNNCNAGCSRVNNGCCLKACHVVYLSVSSKIIRCLKREQKPIKPYISRKKKKKKCDFYRAIRHSSLFSFSFLVLEQVEKTL